MLEVLLNEQSYYLTVGIFMYLASYRVLPLKASRLLCIRVCVVLDGLEDLGAKLSP